MSYIDFNKYTEMGGTIIEQSTFNKLNVQATMLMDRVTFGRLKNTTIVDEVINCAFMLIEQLNTHNDSEAELNGVPIKSMSNTGISVTYSTETATEKQDELGVICNSYLNNVYDNDGLNVLYRGL